MSIGKTARKLLGRHFNSVGKIYRAFFLNVNTFISCIPQFEKGEVLIDIGSGDGEILNKILTQNPLITAIAIDISSDIGKMIKNQNIDRVKFFPNYSIKQYKNSPEFTNARYLLLSDVLHHIPRDKRDEFFDELFLLCNRKTNLIIKDIEPGFFKATLSLFADKYISGDKQTSLISQEEVIYKIKKRYPKIEIERTCLFEKNKPNYCLVFKNFV
jgi:hypothetical protein